MAARTGLNKNNSAVKRIMQEARELANDPSTDYSAAPLEDDIFEWHCTLRGPQGTEFEGGLYHFRILLPTEYPFRPPSIMMLTPNGRFELNTKICISFTNYHEELWQPAWGVRTAIVGLQGFFSLKGTAAVGVGALEYPPSERKRLAALSRDWVCPTCKVPNHEALPDPTSCEETSSSASVATSGSNLVETSTVVTETKVASAEGSPITFTQSPGPVPQIPILAPTPTRPAQPIGIVPLPEEHLTEHAQTAEKKSPQSSSQGRGEDGVVESPVSVEISSPPRPPVVLDMAICVLLVSVFALICRRIF